MKQLKLEVGKTYRSREGKEVKIIGKDRGVRCLYKGSDGEWYAENGSFYCFFGETSRDLIEEVPSETRHTFAIPDGVKKVTVEQVGNRIVVEMVPEKEPQPGDVMINTHGSVYIFKEVVSKNTHNHFAWLGERGRLSIGGPCYPGRPATPEEAQPIFDALRKAGKRWNAETMKVEDVPERDRIMDFLQGYDENATWNHEQLCWLIESYLKYKEGEK